MQEAQREIRNVALLDLTGATSAETLDGVRRIENVASILVPESLLGKTHGHPDAERGRAGVRTLQDCRGASRINAWLS
jgi:hypothetical protein